MTPAARTSLLETAARLRAEADQLELLAGGARVTTRIYSHAVAGAQAMGAARAVGAYLDRAMAGRPTIKAVK